MVKHSISHADISPSLAGSSSPIWRLYLPWLLIAAALAILALRLVFLGGYFPDDAYITFRFAEHLSQGLGIVWNVGGPPVEGSTSFLQVLLLAGTLKLGLAVTTGAQAINLLSVIGLVAILYHASVRLTGGFGLAVSLPLALYLAGVNFSAHVNSGMETVLSMTLLCASFLTSLKLLTKPGWRTAIGLALVNFLCLWCRPDAAFFIMGQSAVLGVVALREWHTGRDLQFIKQLAGSFALLLLLGTVFLVWKNSYFGYILPNSFYVKAADPFAFEGLKPVAKFARDLLFRSALLAPLLIFVDWRSLFVKPHRQTLARIALLVVPAALFLVYNTTVLHIVGFNFRFEYPVAAFYWIAWGWLLSSGHAFERLVAFVARLSRPAGAFGSAAVIAFGILAVATQLDRAKHRQWFSRIQILHYEPVANALLRTGAGPDATVVFDSAGFIPYTSGFSLIDPIGLTDNVLSGRDEITADEREHYIWGANPDVYLGPVPAASPGATSGADDPLIQTEYVQTVLLRSVTFAEYNRFMGGMTYEERLETLHIRMRELRDRWIPVGEIPYPSPNPREYTHFLYVRQGSPYVDQLLAELSLVTTRRIEDINFDGLVDGQRRHTWESVGQLPQPQN